MSLASVSIRRPVAVTMFFLASLLLGGVSLSRLPVSLLPEVQFPRLVVWTTAHTFAPAEVERFVTEPIEEALSVIPGVLRLESVSREGESFVTLTFPWGTEMDFIQLHVRERLDGEAGRLPDGASRPVILRLDPGAEPILIASATARPAGKATLGDVEALVTNVFRRRLEQLDGVGRAIVVGGAQREIVVEVDPARLESHGVSIAQVAAALKGANASAPGGSVRRGSHLFALRLLGELTGAREIATTVVARMPGGGTVRVDDVAEVRHGVAPRESAAYFGGRPSIGILVYRESGANTLAAAKEVERTLAELERRHPEVDLAVVTTQARFIASALQNVVLDLVIGAVLAFLVLFPFLRDPRWPAAIALAIPVSIGSAFTALHVSGVSLNIMSLGGLALGVGMLVDCSIVVLENVFRHRERGLGKAAAAALGAEEVQRAITASTLTAIAVFGPIMYAEGLAGALFGELALAVAFSLLSSLLVALTLLPMIAARLDARPAATSLDVFGRCITALADRYEHALAWALDNRGLVSTWTAGALALGLALASLLPRNLLPVVDEHAFTVRLELPPGTPLERTETQALAVDRWLRTQHDVQAVLTRVGRASVVEVAADEARGRNTAVLDVRLTPSGRSTEEIMDGLRSELVSLPPGALTLETGSATELGRFLGTAAPDLVVEVRGENMTDVRSVAVEAARRLRALPSLADVHEEVDRGHPELRLVLDRGAIARYGLSIESVAQELADRAHGRRATDITELDAKTPVVVRTAGAAVADLNDVLAAKVEGVPLRLLVHVERGTGPAAIHREDQARVVRVTAELARGGLSDAVGAVPQALGPLDTPDGVRFAITGGSVELGRSFRSLALAFLLALALVYLILAAQFESLVQPLVVLLAVPLAVVGAVLALVLTGRGLDTMSLIGIVVLAGIAVNDAIVKIDFINQARREGAALRAAIAEAGRARLRPIVMTSGATILGSLPLALGLGSGSELQAPLAIAMIGGMIFSTTLTLLVIPVAYSLVVEAQCTLRRFG